MMYFTLIFALGLASVLAGPIHEPARSIEVLSKRTDPDTSDDLTEPNVSTVEQAFKDVIEICSYVMTTKDDTVDPILAKYFNPSDKATVLKVFNQILGNPSDPANPDPTGSGELGSILVQSADTDKQCGSSTLAYMGDHNTDNPFIVVCPILFKHKNLFDITCDSLGDTVSYKMLPISGTLLHEYTHWDKLVGSIVGGEVIDQPDGYGPVNAQKLNKSLATKNADSYAYFAMEVFWSVICDKTFGAPRPGIDDDDPACNNEVCQS